MREIKFRAYDTYTKTMLPVVDIIKFTKSEDLYITQDGAYGVGINIQYQPYIELMQYTGLKDKNGTEIYEGDILKYMAIADGEQIDKVIFDRGTYVVDYSEDYKQPVNEINHCAEVIGNIYDNPELLKGE